MFHLQKRHEQPKPGSAGILALGIDETSKHHRGQGCPRSRTLASGNWLALGLGILGLGVFSSIAAAAPYIEYLYPAGVQRGQTIEILLGGRSLDGASQVWVSGSGVTGEVLEVNEPTDAQVKEAKLRDEVAAQTARLRLTISPDAAEGVRDLRIMAREGLSSRFRFQIGKLPEVLEKEPNGTLADAHALSALPVVVNGQILNADRDFFRFSAKKGRKILIEVQARAIKPYLADAVPGWFQARIALYNSKGDLIAEEDDFRFDPDPVMFFNVPEDGEYTVEIWDAVSRGRDDLVYRMTIGELPYVTDFFPLGAPVGSKETTIVMRGINLPGTRAVSKQSFDKAQPGIVQVGFQTKMGPTNKRPFELGDLPEVTERPSDNSSPRLAQRVETPVVINGRIEKPGDADYYAFKAKKGDKLVFDVMARRLGSPLDARISLGPQKLLGKKTVEADDVKDERYGLVTHHADPRVAHTFEADGDYFILIEDTQGKGGPEYGYRLSIAPQQPDFELRVTPDNLSVPAGANVVVQLKAIRLDGFNGPVRLHTEGLPPGFELANAEIPEGKNSAVLTLAAPLDAQPGVYRPRFWAEAEIEGKTVRHNVSAAEELMQAFFYYHTVPVEQGYLIVNQRGPFRIELARAPGAGPLELVLDKETDIPVRVIRDGPQITVGGGSAAAKGGGGKGGGKGKQKAAPKQQAAKQQTTANLPVRVTATRGGKGMIVTAVAIAPGETEGVIKVRCTNAAMVGQEGVFIVEGTQRPRGMKISSLAPALPFKVLPGEEGKEVIFAKSPEDKKAKKEKKKELAE